jgi:hypothetical protein
LTEVFPAIFVATKPRVEFLQVSRIVFHDLPYYGLYAGESSGYPVRLNFTPATYAHLWIGGESHQGKSLKRFTLEDTDTIPSNSSLFPGVCRVLFVFSMR